jgi:phosphonate transport system ATP-binding protein
MVGLGPQAYQRASTLSGGQQQRVAVARALLKGAKVLLADEPVASLDPESARKVMDVLFGLTKELGMTLVVSLHQISIARTYCQRALGMSRGRLVYDGPIADLREQRLKQLYGADAQELLTEEVVAPRHIHTKDISFVSA